MLRSSAGRVAQRLAASVSHNHAAARSCGGSHLERLLVSTAERIADTFHQPQQWHGSECRGFAGAAGDDAEETRDVGNEQVRSLGIAKATWWRLMMQTLDGPCMYTRSSSHGASYCAWRQVQRLAEEIMQLSLLEVSDLTEILQKRLNIQMPAMGAMGAAPAAAAPAAAPAAEPAAPEPAKTEFDVKLTGFEASSKVKIIKEVRTMTSLGLKEAKELVRVSTPKPCFAASPP
jgi:ribosomal protein L7/L12